MQKNIEDILNEWFYRLPTGYAMTPYSDSDLQVLESVLNENKINAFPIIKSLKEMDQLDQAFRDALPVKEDTINEGPSQEYDAAILDRLNADVIPAVVGKYRIESGKSFALPIHPDDKETFEKLYPETAGSAIIGKGEIALYWCFNYQESPIKTLDGRGGDAPDLIIGGERVEVKSYKSHTAQTGLGRWSEFKEGQKVVINLFGIDSLTKAFTPGSNVTVKSELSFTYKNVAEAAQSLITFLNIGSLPELIQAYPIFKTQELGNRAGMHNLIDKYNNKTVDEIFSTYSRTDRDTYAKNVGLLTGLDRKTKLNIKDNPELAAELARGLIILENGLTKEKQRTHLIPSRQALIQAHIDAQVSKDDSEYSKTKWNTDKTNLQKFKSIKSKENLHR